MSIVCNPTLPVLWEKPVMVDFLFGMSAREDRKFQVASLA